MEEIGSQRAWVSSMSKAHERIRQMKSYNHLYEKVLSKENIKSAILKASKGKRKRRKVQRILSDIDAWIPYYQNFISHYKTRHKKPKIIYEGITRKRREIIVPSYDEQVMHHAIVNVLEPIIMKSIYFHSYGSLPRRGAHGAKKYIEKWIRHDSRNCKYFLKMDIKQFFPSVPHDRLYEMLADYIHDERMLTLMHKVIDSTETGLPLGFHTSHWLANWYLCGLDRFIKQELMAVHYIRYMDDLVIFGPNKRKLHKYRIAIADYLEHIGLSMKGNWQLKKFDYNGKGHDLDFMGFRFFSDKTILRKRVMYRMCRRAKKISKKEKPTIYDCRRMMSALGLIDKTDTYDMYLKHIKPYICFRKLKKRISNYDRRNAHVAQE